MSDTSYKESALQFNSIIQKQLADMLIDRHATDVFYTFIGQLPRAKQASIPTGRDGRALEIYDYKENNLVEIYIDTATSSEFRRDSQADIDALEQLGWHLIALATKIKEEKKGQ